MSFRVVPKRIHEMMAVIQAIRMNGHRTDHTEQKPTADPGSNLDDVSNKPHGSLSLESTTVGLYYGEVT